MAAHASEPVVVDRACFLYVRGVQQKNVFDIASTSMRTEPAPRSRRQVLAYPPHFSRADVCRNVYVLLCEDRSVIVVICVTIHGDGGRCWPTRRIFVTLIRVGRYLSCFLWTIHFCFAIAVTRVSLNLERRPRSNSLKG